MTYFREISGRFRAPQGLLEIIGAAESGMTSSADTLVSFPAIEAARRGEFQ